MHIRLIDANSLGHAQHHGQPERLAKQEHPVQAVFGVLNNLRQHLQNAPDVLNVLIWDGRAQWRYDLHPGYKSGRHKTPEQRRARQAYEWQQPWIQRAVACLPLVQITHPHAEADDLGWGISQQLSRQGHMVTLATTDSDWLQGVKQRVRWQNVRTPHQVVELEGFSKSSGGFFSPASVAPVKALAGDTSDDIEGVNQVGDKRAMGLLSKYKSIPELLAAADDFMAFSAEPSYAHGLMNAEVRERVLRNLRLIDLSAGPALAGSDCHLVVRPDSSLDLYEIFVDLEFLHWQEQFQGWERLCNREMDPAALQIVERAIAAMKSSWSEPS